MKLEVGLLPGEILFLSDGKHTVGAARAAGVRRVFIETGTEELIQFLDADDLIAVSAFSAGPAAKKGIACLLYLTREAGMPLLVLPKDHPATGRLPMVVSAGEKIRLTSCIVPGTHPEQDVLCGRGGLDGLVLTGRRGQVLVEGPGARIGVETAPFLYYANLK